MTKVFFVVKHYSSTESKIFLPEFEPLMLSNSTTTINFFKTKSDYYYNLNVVSSTQPFITLFWQQTMLNRLPYLVDAYAIVEPTDSVFYIFNCFFSNKFTNFLFKLKSKNYLSITSFCKSAGWVERELKEFSTLYIEGLTDSRRLLTDYTSFKTKLTPIYYDLISQEIF